MQCSYPRHRKTCSIAWVVLEYQLICVVNWGPRQAHNRERKNVESSFWPYFTAVAPPGLPQGAIIVIFPPTTGLRSFSVQLNSTKRFISVTRLNLSVMRHGEARAIGSSMVS
jgi:hypothetical protein